LTEPTTYYSTSRNLWRLIHQGMPACKDGTLEEAERCAAAYKLTPAPDYWDGDSGTFKSISGREKERAAVAFLAATLSLQADEAAAFSLMPTDNQPRTTSAQTPLF
jgi:hypothetical protein